MRLRIEKKVSIDENLYTVEGDPEQPIMCELHPGNDGCTDIQKALIENADAEQLWAQAHPTGHLMIPVAPTSDIYQTVEVDPIYEEGSNNSVLWRISLPDPMTDATEFLGFLNEGEGRGIVRNMIINWAEVEFVDIRCKFQGHSIHEELAWKANSKHRQKAFADRWAVLRGSMCTACRLKASGGVNDLDLVPDSGDTYGKRRQREEQARIDAMKSTGSNPSYANNEYDSPKMARPAARKYPAPIGRGPSGKPMFKTKEEEDDYWA